MASYNNNSHPLPPPPGQDPASHHPVPVPQYNTQYNAQYPSRQPQQSEQLTPQLTHQLTHQLTQQSTQQTHQGPPPVQRPSAQSRKSRTFSYSGKSNDLHETSAEKEAKRLHSKADPTLAMNEMEPSAVAAGVKSSMASVRDIQHRDPAGQVITEPDRSNPTRWRGERPLQTLRSFQDAIDNSYSTSTSSSSRRHSTMGGGSPPEHVTLKRMQAQRHGALDSTARFNPRNSYAPSSAGRFHRDSYYGGRPQSVMYGEGSSQQRDGYLDAPQAQSYGYSPSQGHPGARRGHPNRMQSEPQHNSYRQQQSQNVYPSAENHRSYETVASGAGSGASGDQAGYQTDPTSDESSIERRQSPAKPVNDYGIAFNQSPGQPAAFTVGIRSPDLAGPSNGNYQSTPRSNFANPPQVPHKDSSSRLSVIQRKPTANPNLSVSQAQSRPVIEKRQSWFGRRFGKKA